MMLLIIIIGAKLVEAIGVISFVSFLSFQNGRNSKCYQKLHKIIDKA